MAKISIPGLRWAMIGLLTPGSIIHDLTGSVLAVTPSAMQPSAAIRSEPVTQRLPIAQP